jgi:hypothetical protein
VDEMVILKEAVSTWELLRQFPLRWFSGALSIAIGVSGDYR